MDVGVILIDLLRTTDLLYMATFYSDMSRQTHYRGGYTIVALQQLQMANFCSVINAQLHR